MQCGLVQLYLHLLPSELSFNVNHVQHVMQHARLELVVRRRVCVCSVCAVCVCAVCAVKGRVSKRAMSGRYPRDKNCTQQEQAREPLAREGERETHTVLITSCETRRCVDFDKPRLEVGVKEDIIAVELEGVLVLDHHLLHRQERAEHHGLCVCKHLVHCWHAVLRGLQQRWQLAAGEGEGGERGWRCCCTINILRLRRPHLQPCALL